MNARLLFYCQHVLGMGHMARSREIVRGLEAFDVWFINGGEPVEGFSFPSEVRVVQLPPIHSDTEFRDIDASERVKTERRDILLGLLDSVQPDVIVIEMFPFGRRKFAFELLPLLEEVERRGRQALVVSSVRDILVSKRDQARHEEQACRILNRHFDLVLVHSDPKFQRLEETFLRAGDLRVPVAYTGFVTEPVVPQVIASAGGGRVGFELLHAVVRASLTLHSRVPHRLSVFTGPYLPDHEYAMLLSNAEGVSWIQVDRFATDFVARLAGAGLLVSMAGYNTCMNIVATGVPALVYPFRGNQNEEQSIRAEKLERLGVLGVLNESDLAAVPLAARIERILSSGTGPKLDLNGAANTAQLLVEALKGCVAHV